MHLQHWKHVPKAGGQTRDGPQESSGIRERESLIIVRNVAIISQHLFGPRAFSSERNSTPLLSWSHW
ncbi:MAG TPA: hypothetical protein DCG12_22800 [Planctomycetaceae bacterium]|nr:hypothetical protein [Planctomycetaceae bacterium]